jgi:PAS domain S-box-containing protein
VPSMQEATALIHPSAGSGPGSGPGSSPRILYMEDDPGMASLFQKKLERAGYTVDLARDGREGLAMYAAGSYDVVVMDHAMPGYDGLAVLRTLAAQGPLPPVIMVTGAGDEKVAVEAMKLGAGDYIVKDVDGGYLGLLPTVIERLRQRQRLVMEKLQAEERLRVNLTRTEALYHAARSLIAFENLSDALQTVVDSVVETLPADRVALNTLNEPVSSEDELEARWVTHFVKSGPGASHIVRATPEELRDGLTGWVLREQRPALSPKGMADPRESPRVQKRRAETDCGAVMIVPLQYRGQTLGILMAINRPEERDFTQQDVEFLAALGNQVAMAIENAWLVEGLEKQVAERTAEILAEREKSEAILQSVGDAIIMTDLQGRIQYVNEAFTALTGHTAQEAQGQKIHALLSAEMPEQELQSLQRAVTEGTLWQGEAIMRRKDGRTYEAALTIAPVRDPQDRLVGYVSSHRDISRLKELDRARGQFIANVSHELRTPVTNLKLYVQLLQKGQETEKAGRYLQALEEQTNRLSQFVQDILEITTLDSGQAVAAWRPVMLSSVIESVIARHRRQAEASSLTLTARPVSPDWPVVKGDSVRLAQALGELVENAIVFTPPAGQVTIVPEVVEEEGRSWMTVAVRDTGPGISPEEQDRIFGRFYRGKLAESGHIPGNGLGLSIAQAIMQAHGGRVTVESQVGAGSTFRVWIPVQ